MGLVEAAEVHHQACGVVPHRVPEQGHHHRYLGVGLHELPLEVELVGGGLPVPPPQEVDDPVHPGHGAGPILLHLGNPRRPGLRCLPPLPPLDSVTSI